MVAKRVLISIDERLLDRIDEACERLGMTRSAFLAQSASRDLEGGKGPGADPEVHGAMATIDRLVTGSER